MPDSIHGILHGTEYHDHHNQQTCNTKGPKGGKIGIIHIIKDSINGLVQVTIERRGWPLLYRSYRICQIR
ncbi:MAG: hypothetical protein D3925_05205 [Candidatus Electrothrix sp. AR5]|nr:hypothetical protein [Candidatus Electrothrix sp. AR5]